MERYLKEVEEQETQWDGSDYERCAPCYPMIGDFGTPQCTECLGWGTPYKKWVIKCFQELHGDDAKEEYKKLLEVKSLLRRKRFDQLRKIHIVYYDKNGVIETSRGFYEKYNG